MHWEKVCSAYDSSQSLGQKVLPCAAAPTTFDEGYAVPAMPVVCGNGKTGMTAGDNPYAGIMESMSLGGHRLKNARSWLPFNAMVSRSAGQKEIASNPAAKAAMDKEWTRLIARCLGLRFGA